MTITPTSQASPAPTPAHILGSPEVIVLLLGFPLCTLGLALVCVTQ
jgi:hypothetical protein